MSDTGELIRKLQGSGLRLCAKYGRLKVNGPRQAVEMHSAEIREKKQEIISFLYGVSLADMRNEAGHEWEKVKNDHKWLHHLAESVKVKRLRERGVQPESYKAVRDCDQCGPVWLEPWTPHQVAGCPWCLNREKGLPIPHPKTNMADRQDQTLTKVTCGACANFTPDTINPGEGIGSCSLKDSPKAGQPSPWPMAKRQCPAFLAKRNE